jgi:pyruvate dehydrogenase E2 component (dihydrolipoamide acetyltransferase)
LALQNAVVLSEIEGSGKGGRITVNDVKRALKAGGKTALPLSSYYNVYSYGKEYNATRKALSLARENLVPLNMVEGTGKGGRITYRDVKRFVGEPKASDVSFDVAELMENA